MTLHTMVDISCFLPATRHAIEEWSFANDLDEVIGDRGWLPLEWASFLYFALEAAADTPELFPHGKWATLQHLRAHINEAITTPEVE